MEETYTMTVPYRGKLIFTVKDGCAVQWEHRCAHWFKMDSGFAQFVCHEEAMAYIDKVCRAIEEKYGVKVQ